jgi:hypothetical protein
VKKSSDFIQQKKGHKWREVSVKIENSFFLTIRWSLWVCGMILFFEKNVAHNEINVN